MNLEDRAKLIFALKQKHVKDVAVLSAIETTDRALFIEGVFKARAYEDIPLPIAAGQTISAPSIVAQMTEALKLDKRCKVLEIGAGSGYQTAILSKLARRVYSIERVHDLAKIAEDRIKSLNLHNVMIISGDGSMGFEQQAPFDRILLTAFAEDIPSTLLAQLKMGGIMVIPVGQSDMKQSLLRVTKTENGLEYEELGPVKFVPLLPGRAK